MKPNFPFFRKHIILIVAAMTLATVAVPSRAQNPHENSYEVSFLVSDQPGVAAQTDTKLLNAWGLDFGPGGNVIVADNHSDLATFYDPNGTPIPFTINVVSAPTGMAANHSRHNFRISSGASTAAADLLFCTEAGTILGYSAAADLHYALLAVDDSASGAIFKGLALGKHGRRLLYAADFHNGLVKVYDSDFHFAGDFTDPNVDPGFAPFNIRNIRGRLYVTFAKQDENAEDDEPGPGNGFVDIFSPDGHLLKRLISHGNLNSPWGLALAPEKFGQFGGALLVGNFGDGAINAYHPESGEFLGALTDKDGKPILIPGLWALNFKARHVSHGDHDEDNRATIDLYFTAGPGGENDGLLGLIRPVPHPHH